MLSLVSFSWDLPMLSLVSFSVDLPMLSLVSFSGGPTHVVLGEF